jgi:hypothetical protein
MIRGGCRSSRRASADDSRIRKSCHAEIAALKLGTSAKTCSLSIRPPGLEVEMRYWFARAITAVIWLCLVSGMAQAVVDEIANSQLDAFEPRFSLDFDSSATSAFRSHAAPCDPAYCILDAFGQLNWGNIAHPSAETLFPFDDFVLVPNCIVSDDSNCPYDPTQTSPMMWLILPSSEHEFRDFR